MNKFKMLIFSYNNDGSVHQFKYSYVTYNFKSIIRIYFLKKTTTLENNGINPRLHVV